MKMAKRAQKSIINLVMVEEIQLFGFTTLIFHGTCGSLITTKVRDKATHSFMTMNTARSHCLTNGYGTAAKREIWSQMRRLKWFVLMALIQPTHHHHLIVVMN